MGRDLQKRKRRAGSQPIRQASRSKKILNPRGNSIIAQNWDKTKTLAQNYKRLGLTAQLRTAPGGVEKLIKKSTDPRLTGNREDTFAIKPVEQAIVSEAKVERDANGKIIRIISSTNRSNPLNDPLRPYDTDSEAENEEDDDRGGGRSHGKDLEEWHGISEEEGATEVVKSLLQEARNPAEKKPRHQSEREQDWLEVLVARHGDDYGAMARDAKSNPMQQTAADLRRRIRKANSRKTS